VVLLQRKSSSVGKGLGKTSGWVHRAALKAKGVEQVTGVVSYDRIDDEGLHVTVAARPEKGAAKGAEVPEQRTYAVDSVVVCAGQESVRTVADALQERGLTVHVIGGADVAAELDAKHAIRQGTEVAARI
jgi:2,4-dienoyl-CoA reductase (NADPH2)